MKYHAIKITQSPESEPFYLISAKADDIVSWADAPRKVASFKVGFQRELNDSRVEDIAEYLRLSDENILPGAILIAINENDIEINPTDLGDIFEIEIKDKEELSNEDLVSYYISLYESRLSDLEKEKVETATTQLNNDENEENDEEVSEESDDIVPKSYLSDIVIALKKFDTLDAPVKTNILNYLRVNYKPGIILDGQHRVFGAKSISEHSVYLPTVLFPDMKESEQVFHFYVMNNKAVPINKTELRNVISTSLSDKEIDDLYDRFSAMGVHAKEAKWTTDINTDAESPFKGYISFGLRDGEGFIKENVMDQVIKQFMNPGRKFKPIFKDFDDWFDKNDKSIAYKFNLFYTFWDTIKSMYSLAWEYAIKKQGGQILMKASLLTLQEFYFEGLISDTPRRTLKQEPSPFSSIENFKESVQIKFAYIPEEFFLNEWKRKDIDTTTGRKEMKDKLILLEQNMGDIKKIKSYFK